jgi:transposase
MSSSRTCHLKCQGGGADRGSWPARRIIEAILYVDRTGCAWRYLPAEFPPWRTVYGYLPPGAMTARWPRLHVPLE